MAKNKKQNSKPKFSMSVVCKQCGISFEVGTDDLYLYNTKDGETVVMADCVCGKSNRVRNVPSGVFDISMI